MITAVATPIAMLASLFRLMSLMIVSIAESSFELIARSPMYSYVSLRRSAAV